MLRLQRPSGMKKDCDAFPIRRLFCWVSVSARQKQSRRPRGKVPSAQAGSEAFGVRREKNLHLGDLENIFFHRMYLNTFISVDAQRYKHICTSRRGLPGQAPA